MKDRFKKEPHLLRYEDDKLEHVTLGFTTREGGSSPYPERAFNMARYIDDAPEHVTKHQQLLISLERIGYFQYKHTRTKWLRLPYETKVQISMRLVTS